MSLCADIEPSFRGTRCLGRLVVRASSLGLGLSLGFRGSGFRVSNFEEAATERLLEEIAGNYSCELRELKSAGFL